MDVIAHEPGAIRVSAEDCENASLPAAAQTLRDLADEVEASRPQLRGAVGTLVRIATRDYDPLQHESPGSLARETLTAMGVVERERWRERWPLTIYVCENCGKPDQDHGDVCVCDGPKRLRSVEVVPADHLRGAVEALSALREAGLLVLPDREPYVEAATTIRSLLGRRDRSGDAATKRALMAVSARDPEGAADRIMRLEGELEASRQQLRGAVGALRVIANNTTHDGRWAAGRAESALVAMGVDPRPTGGSE